MAALVPVRTLRSRAWLVILLAFAGSSTKFTCLAATDDQFPDVSNPLEFVGFERAKAGVQKAMMDFGNILNNPEIETMQIWCTLLWRDRKYIPGPCPQDGETPIENSNLRNLSLTYVYGRPDGFTSTYLRIPAPNRFYSLTTLSSKVKWGAKERTLQLQVRNDSISDETWANSSDLQRRAFVHYVINQTLFQALTKVSESHGATFLPGTIYVRNHSTQVGAIFPYFFGKVDTYESCQVNRRVSNLTRPYTVCSSWERLNDAPFILLIWDVVALFQIYLSGYIFCVYFISFFFDLKLFGALLQYLPKSRKRKTPVYMADGHFPQCLSVRNVFFGSPPLTKDRQRSSRPNVCRKVAFALAVLLFIAVFMLLLLVASKLYYYNTFNVPGVPATCFIDSAYKLSIALCTISAVFLVSFAILSCWLAFKGHSTVSNMIRNGGRQSNIIAACASVYTMVSAPCSFIVATVCVNVVIIACFTLAGVLFFWTNYIVGVLMIAFVILHFLLKVTRINATISPDIARCKVALDQANKQVRAKMYEMGQGDARRIAKLMDVNINIRALLSLCHDHLQLEDEEDNSNSANSANLEAANLLQEQQEADFYTALAAEIKYRFCVHVGRALAYGCAAAILLGYLQVFFVHFGALTETSPATKYFLPLSFAGKFLIDSLGKWFSASLPQQKEPHLVAHARDLLEKLTAPTGAGNVSFLQPGGVPLVRPGEQINM